MITFCNHREISHRGKQLLLIQCDTGDENSNLVECARHCIQREVKSNSLDVCVVFLVHLSRVSKSYFSGFQVCLLAHYCRTQVMFNLIHFLFHISELYIYNLGTFV